MACPIGRAQIVLFGDSITENSFQSGGWGAALAQHYSRRADVLPRGFTGYNSRWAHRYATRIFPGPRQDFSRLRLVIVFFGTNDAALSDVCPDYHVTLEEYERNLASIVESIRDRYPACPVLVISPGAVCNGACTLSVDGELEHTNEEAGKYADVAVAAATALGVPVLNLYAAMQSSSSGVEPLLCDGLHLSALGSQLLFERLIELIDDCFPDLAAEWLPLELPLVNDLDEATWE